MVFYNKLGTNQIIISATIGGVMAFILSFFYPDSAVRLLVVIAGISLLILDWRHRDRAKEFAKYGYQQTFLRFLGPTDGGNMMFIPTWIIGAGAIIWGVAGKI